MEGKEPTREELLNKISLLKEALKFYGDEQNYFTKNNETQSRISNDAGLQARFALDQLKKIDSYNADVFNSSSQMINNYSEEIDDLDIDNETTEKLEKISNIINKWKNKE